MDALSIRLASPNDLDALLPLVREYRVFYEQQPDAQRERDYVAAHLRNATSALFIAETNATAAGFMQLFQTFSTVHLAGSWILEDLFVDPRFRRAGIAGALLARALQHVRENGGCGMFLETARDNLTAQRAYERAGWVREARFLKYNAPLP